MPNNKSPWNNGVTKEFYEAFWDDLKIPLLLSVNKAFKVWELSASQKWAVSKVIEKKTKLNDLLKIGHQFSSQRWHKTGFKSLAEHLKTVLLISSNQTAHLKSRFTSEGGRLICDIFEVSVLL